MERLTIDEIIGHCERKTEQYERFHEREYLEAMPLTSSVMKEYWEHRQVAEYLRRLKNYEGLEGRLNKIYGDCDGLLESMVELLEKHSGVDIPDDTVKVLLITNESVDFYKKCKSLEEQGRLIELPVKDDTAGHRECVHINSTCYHENCKCSECPLTELFCDEFYKAIDRCYEEAYASGCLAGIELGKSEAEAKLKELRGNNNGK